MKEKIITEIIPATHRNLVLFLFLFFFGFFFTYVALLEGIHVERLNVSGILVEKLYLKWDHALHIRAEKIDLNALSTEDTSLTLKSLSKLPPIIRNVERWVDSIEVDNLYYHTFKVSFKYNKNHIGTIQLHVDHKTAAGQFTLNENYFKLLLPSISIRNATFSLGLKSDLHRETLQAAVSARFPDTPLIRATVHGDVDTLTFAVSSDYPIKRIAPLIDFFELDPDVRPWIVDYAKISSVKLERLEGTFPYEHPEQLIHSLKANALVETAEYTFAQGQEPIKAPYVALRYETGKLHIVPIDGRFSDLPTEQSRLYIDFTTPHTTLDAFIRTEHAQLNDPVYSLLEYYGIRLPLRQLSGACAVDLNLSVNLFDLTTTAHGSFTPTPSEMLLDKFTFTTRGGTVRLDENHIQFGNFDVHNAILGTDARVEGEFDASKQSGNVRIDAYRSIPTGDASALKLQEAPVPLRVRYAISPSGDRLDFSASVWNMLGEKLSIDPFSIPFNYQNSSLTVPSAAFSYGNSVQGKITAELDILAKTASAQIRLNALDLNGTRLMQPSLETTLRYDNSALNIDVTDASSWSIHQFPVLLSPLHAVYKNKSFSIESAEVVLDDLLKADFTGKYSLDNQKGSIRIAHLHPLKPAIATYVDSNDTVRIGIALSGMTLNLDVPDYKTRFSTVPSGWKIELSDIALLSAKSPLLQRYHIDNGHLNLYYSGEKTLYNFNGEINYPYAIAMINEKPVNRYRFSGIYQDGKSLIRVNNRVVIRHSDKETSIRANNVGINTPELIRFLSTQSASKNDTTKKSSDDEQTVSIQADHTYLFLMEKRRIIADTLTAQLTNDNLDAQLDYMAGHANLKIRSGMFAINGRNFNDRFMDRLFALSDFEGGNFSFSAKGEMNAFDGIMRVENTVLKDYKVLNNVLAFINTIPSLATFSLPNYHSQGLPVTEGYTHFSYEKGIMKVDNFTLNSHEIKITGESRADFNANTVNGSLTLKTDLGSKLSKLPVVGYILFGKDGSLSTTVGISGNLENPKVETAIAKEIVTAPFNILKRTLSYPFLWMLPDEPKKQ